MADAHAYSLGTSEAELARLDAQAATIATPTMRLLDRAGIGEVQAYGRVDAHSRWDIGS